MYVHCAVNVLRLIAIAETSVYTQADIQNKQADDLF